MRRLILRVVLAIGLVLAWVGPAEAHPLGNFTINQFSRIEVGKTEVHVHYVVDMAEIPSFQTLQEIDTNGDGQLNPAEQQAYIEKQAAELSAGLHLAIDGTELPLRIGERNLNMLPGQGGLNTMRLTFDLTAARPNANPNATLIYRVENYRERLGWREIVAVASDGVTLSKTNVPSTTVSDELRSYPQDALSSPLDVREANLSVELGGVAAANGLPQAATGRPSTRADDQLAALIASRDLTPGAIALALVLAFILGAGHALTPGHGKTIVAAYLVGARGTPLHAIFLGLTTTLTHTAGVFLLGFITLAISRYILPEQIYPWLEFASGLMVVIIGIALFRSRLILLLQRNKAGTHSHSDNWLDQDHEHGPDTHTHDHDEALADWAAGRASGQKVERPGVSWRSLLALGVSGGLIPCPSALIVLLGAIALGRIGFGLLLILSFSIGLAAVLTALGMLLVYARGLFEKMPMNGLLMKALPVASAALVTIAGAIITYGGLVQAGIVKL